MGLKLFKFECGCIGFEPDSEGKAICVQACDADWTDDAYYISREASHRTIGKAFEPLPEAMCQEITTELGHLVRDGYRFRKIRSLLK